MKLTSYLRDKLYFILISFFTVLIITLMFMAFKIDKYIIFVTIFIVSISYVAVFLIDYYRKKKFYDNLLFNIDSLDKAYLVLETLEEPTFYEGKLIFDALYKINKSMLENVNSIKRQNKDFKEYVEMWIHEVKIPLSSILLTINNHKKDAILKIRSNVKRLEDYVDQVLYYVRQEFAEKDYMIKKVNLASIIKNVGLKNMDDLLEEKIEFKVSNVDTYVFTDSKWLEFIIGQIINNSIKYKRNIKSSFIKIYTEENKTKTTLVIEDNGIGIPESDIKQVFNKSFTGENGRTRSKSTGMGLYIAKSLCEKMGHEISIESEINKYTKVTISFFKNDFYSIVK